MTIAGAANVPAFCWEKTVASSQSGLKLRNDSIWLKMEEEQEEHTAAAPRVFETSLRVRYAETDQMGVVYHANYIVWFEVGRVEMLRDLGFHYRQMEQHDNTHIVVVDARCRFKAPAHYDDLIAIRTRLLNVRDSLLHFGYEVIRSDDGTLLAEGETVHLVVDAEFKRIRLPEKYREPFLQAAGKKMQRAAGS